MNLRKQLATNNNCYKAGKGLVVRGVMWHSTGANNNKLKRYVGPDDGVLGQNKNGNHWNQPLPDGRQVCVHAFIGLTDDGAVATYQTLPWEMRGWHGGSGKNGTVNTTHIGFEICEDGLVDKDYFDKIYNEACELTAMLCKQFNLDPMADGVVICHSEGYRRGVASNHGDVMHWFPRHGKTMDDARRDVAALMGSGTSAPPQPGVPATPGPTGYLVKIVRNDLNIRKGPGTNFPVVSTIVPGSYTIVGQSVGQGASMWGQLKSGAGWVSLDFIEGAAATIRKGDLVKVKYGAKSYSGQSISKFVYNGSHYVDDVNEDRVLLDKGGICTAFNIRDLTKV